jgi:ketosteroid isomerase-like protein
MSESDDLFALSERLRSQSSRGDDPGVTQPLKAMVAAWDQAMIENDADKIGQFMHDDWVIVGSDGGISDKPTFLAQIRQGRLSHDIMTSEDLRIREYGDVAVLIATGVSGGLFDGHAFREHERQSSVFVKAHGEWRCVITHLSRLPAAPPPGKGESPTGEY